MKQLQLRCHCGGVDASVVLRGEARLDMCHCCACRHSTGQLYSSYYAIETPPSEVTSSSKLTKYNTAQAPSNGISEAHAETDNAAAARSEAGVTLYFCNTCGCHLLRRASGDVDEETWEAATGAVDESEDGEAAQAPALLGEHFNVTSTRDGGLSFWAVDMEVADSWSPGEDPTHGPSPPAAAPSADEEATTLHAACLCGGVSFRVTPPSEASLAPRSGFSDLIIPFHTQDPDIANPRDVKWWLREGGSKYLAGLCACRSCRLASGFELQSWAFVPRANIEVPRAGGSWAALDFDAPHTSGGGGGTTTMRAYGSSEGVTREFCARCGACVFWHDRWRPDLVDVSAGLLRAADGARAEGLLDWCRERVSFVEDAGLGRRRGAPAANALSLVDGIEREMRRAWRELSTEQG